METNSQRGEIDIFRSIVLGVLGLAAFGAYALLHNGLGVGGEREGTIKYADCRVVIQTKPDDWQIATKEFVCVKQRTESGVLMSAECASVETNQYGGCDRAYVYHRPPAARCPENAPFLGYDDKCHAEYEGGYVHAFKK